MRLNSSSFLSLIFLILLLCPFALGLVGAKSVDLENRRFAEWPRHLTARDYLDINTYEKIEKYLRDHMPLRSFFLRMNGLLSIALWGESPETKTYIANDGKMYFCEGDLFSYCAGAPIKEQVAALSSIHDLLASHGKEFLFTIAPNKNSLFPELMTFKERKLNECSVKRRDELRKLIAPYTRNWFVDLWAVESAGLPQQPSTPLYYTTDDHWSAYGAARAAEEIIDRLRPNMWEKDSITFIPTQEKTGGMARFMGIPGTEATNKVEVTRPGIIRQPIEETVMIPGMPPMTTARNSGNNANLLSGRTLFLHDSFGYFPIQALAPYFETFVSMNWSYSTHEQIARQMALADRIIIETAERDFSYRMVPIFADPAFLDSLRTSMAQLPSQ